MQRLHSSPCLYNGAAELQSLISINTRSVHVGTELITASNNYAFMPLRAYKLQSRVSRYVMRYVQ